MKNIDLPPKIKTALNDFVRQHKKDPRVMGILVAGSHVTDTPDKNSDLDVFIIFNNCSVKEKGTTWIQGVEVEYFKTNLTQIKRSFREEKHGKNNSRTIHLFAHSRILYQKDPKIKQLTREARSLLREKLPEPDEFQIEILKYHLDNMKKDLEDVHLRKDTFAFKLISNQLIFHIIDTFFQVQRTPKETPKRLQKQIKKIDPKFARLLSRALSKKVNPAKFKAIRNLADYTEENLLGGKKPQEWKIKLHNRSNTKS